MNIGLIKSKKLGRELTEAEQEQVLRNKVKNDEDSIEKYQAQLDRYTWAIKRCKKRIKVNKKILKRHFLDIEQL